MSLSRPATFPLLKLPFLCIESVIKSWTVFDIIFLALLSKRTRHIVKHLKIPLNGIQISLSCSNYITLDSLNRQWVFESKTQSFFDEHQNLSEYPLVLQKNAVPLYTRPFILQQRLRVLRILLPQSSLFGRTDISLKSYTKENEVTAVKYAMKFLNEVFKCSVRTVIIGKDDFPDSLGFKSTENLHIRYHHSQFGEARKQQLNLMLKNLEVTGECNFWVITTENDFYCDPKLFKCKKLVFWSSDSAAWVTRDILLQFEVPQLRFDGSMLSEEDIVAFITQWFHSDNRKIEYLYIEFEGRQISLETFRTMDLNQLPFVERKRVPSSESFPRIDFSEGLEFRRNDGLVATIHVNNIEEHFLFYVWHDQPAIAQ